MKREWIVNDGGTRNLILISVIKWAIKEHERHSAVYNSTLANLKDRVRAGGIFLKFIYFILLTSNRLFQIY